MKIYRGIPRPHNMVYYPMIEKYLGREDCRFFSTIWTQAKGYDDAGMLEFSDDHGVEFHWVDGVSDLINNFSSWVQYEKERTTDLFDDIQGDIGILNTYLDYDNKEAVRAMKEFRDLCTYCSGTTIDPDHKGEVWMSRKDYDENLLTMSSS